MRWHRIPASLSKGGTLSFVRDQPSDSAADSSGASSALSIPLGSVITIQRGYAVRSRAPEDSCSPDEPGAVRLLWLKHLGRDGSIAEADEGADVWRTDVPSRYHLQAGDLLLSEIVTGRPKAARVEQSDLPAAAVGSILVLRPTVTVSAEHARLILALLRSEAVAGLARERFGRARIASKDLMDLMLPAPDEALSTALEDLDAASQQMSRWSADASAVANLIFDTDVSLDSARRSVIQVGQLSRLRAEAAAQLDDPSYIIRTRMPYPVALRWRELEARLSTSDPGPAYDAVLEAAEVLLGYSALIAAALAHHAGVELASVAALRRRLSGGPGGPGLGEWVAILQEISGAKKRRGLSSDHPLHDFGALLSRQEAEAARRRLSARRNDKAHGRTLDAVTLPSALEEAHQDLSILMAGSLFLADLHLIHVSSVTWDAFRENAAVTFRRLVGDHPVVPTTTMEYPSNKIETGSLYLADRDRRLHLLRPFLTCEICETCRAWSTFHVDKVGGELTQKSLEHGHSYPYKADATILQAAGLL